MDTPDMSIPLPQNPALQDFLVEYAVYQFNRLDKYLLDVRIDEMCMCARVAFYVQAWLWIHHYMQYSVDVEYNRGCNGVEADPKRLGGKGVRLDLVVHKRGYDPSGEGFTNILCIEMKKASNPRGCEEDEDRLKMLTDPDWGFGYRAGYMLYAVDKGEKRTLRIKEVFREGKPARAAARNQ